MLYAERYEALRQSLRKTRRKAKLTQVELAQRLDKGQSYVSKVEQGERHIDVLEFVLWCEACGASPAKVISQI